jgi:Uma2 family endonuclease
LGEVRTASHHTRYTLEEYLRLEEYANVKHEYLDGQIYAMAGGTPEHGAMAVRIGAALLGQLRGRRCNVYSSDVRVRVEATGLDTYPDLSVVCGREERDVHDRNALTNPIVLVEILSPGTEEYDRGEKLDHYKRLPSLREVVLVAHDRPRIEVWRRPDAPDQWTLLEFGPGETAHLESIDCDLDLNDLFRDPMA